MQNGGKALFRFKFQDLEPAPAVDVDPAAGVEVEMRSPAGVETIWQYPADIQIVRDNLGDYHLQSPPLDEVDGGVWTFIARATGYPESRCEITVEPSYW